MKKPYVIAEIGVNYYDTARQKGISVIDAAKEYILSAKRAGVDAVKFQSYKADKIASKNSPAYWDITKETTTSQFDLFSKFDSFGTNEYHELAAYSKEIGVDFLSTPFDYDAVDYLEDIVNIYKISSSDLNNIPFVKYIASKGKPVYISIGASYLSEVVEIVRILKESGCREIGLLHCVLSYPCKVSNANLKKIQRLKSIFPDIKIGYSDHTVPDETMSVLTSAYILGAEIIEKHFTLDKELLGNDHYHAGDENDFRRAINNFDIVRNAVGDGKLDFLECERQSRREARRSLVIARNMKRGEIIKPEDIIEKRPAHGIPPRMREIVIGRVVTVDIEEDTILDWNMI